MIYNNIVKNYHMLRIPKETADRFDKFKAKGQTDAGLLEELLDLAERAGFGRLANGLGLLRPTEGLPLPKKSKRGRWKK